MRVIEQTPDRLVAQDSMALVRVLGALVLVGGLVGSMFATRRVANATTPIHVPDALWEWLLAGLLAGGLLLAPVVALLVCTALVADERWEFDRASGALTVSRLHPLSRRSIAHLPFSEITDVGAHETFHTDDETRETISDGFVLHLTLGESGGAIRTAWPSSLPSVGELFGKGRSLSESARQLSDLYRTITSEQGSESVTISLPFWGDRQRPPVEEHAAWIRATFLRR
jgi:hypothetical protein